jgi:hypothetical protein
LQSIAFIVWAIELEIETLFIEPGWRPVLARMRLFPAKLAVRIAFLVVGGYHAARLQLAAGHCEATQAATLARIVAAGRRTVYGRDHQFDAIKSSADFAANVPIQTYTEHEPYIEREMRGERHVIAPEAPIMYATTSGTTGKPKFVPVTASAARHSHRNVSLVWLYYLARRNVGFLNDYLVAITGQPVEGHTPDGTPFGSASGHIRAGLPRFMQRIYAVPEAVFLINDYEARYYCLALFSLRVQVSHVTTANPSTLVILFEKIAKHQEQLIRDIERGSIDASVGIDPATRKLLEAELTPDPRRARELRDGIVVAGHLDPAFYWPRLSSLACWKGGNAPLFIERLRRLIPDVVPIFDLGYLASEVRATVPVERSHHGGLPTLHRNYFEFVPVDEWRAGSRRTLRLHQLQLGGSYYVIVTTDTGLYRYHINDIVRVIGFYRDTPELVFEQKGDGVTNLTGEKLYEQQLQIAAARAALRTATPLRFYMGVLNASSSRYEFLVEPAETFADDAASRLLVALDHELGEVNMEYRSKRESLRLLAPVMHELALGAFEAYRNRRVQAGVREAQFKMVLLTANDAIVKDFDVRTTHHLA